MNKKRPLISLIAAIDKNNLIGGSGKIPWIIPGELKRFKEVTMGKPIVMGRKTHESIGRVLVGRENIVLSLNKSFKKEGVAVYDNFENVIKEYLRFSEIMVIGGSPTTPSPLTFWIFPLASSITQCLESNLAPILPLFTIETVYKK